MSRGGILSVASGKGGTGKTTVAVGLALTAPGTVRLVDCVLECHDYGVHCLGAFRSALRGGAGSAYTKSVEIGFHIRYTEPDQIV